MWLNTIILQVWKILTISTSLPPRQQHRTSETRPYTHSMWYTPLGNEQNQSHTKLYPFSGTTNMKLKYAYFGKKTHSVVSCNSRASIPIITEHLLNLNRFRAGEGIERISPNHLVHHNDRWNEACELLCAKQWSHHGFAIRSLHGAASHRITVTWNLLWQLLQVTQ